MLKKLKNRKEQKKQVAQMRILEIYIHWDFPKEKDSEQSG